MIKWFQAVSFAVVVAAAGPAYAKGMDGFWLGLNGVLTALADPVAGFTDPPDRFDELPVHEVTGRLLGLVQGTLLGAYRASSGLVDVATTPLWVVPTISPAPRFEVIVQERRWHLVPRQ